MDLVLFIGCRSMFGPAVSPYQWIGQYHPHQMDSFPLPKLRQQLYYEHLQQSPERY
jgi:hypothetical protein